MKQQISKLKKHKTWQMQEAKAKFSHLVDEVKKNGYQTITRNGEPVAVIVSKEEFDEMIQPKNSLLNFFKAAPYPEIELDIQRSNDTPRELDL